jgi:hypothetical protein
MLQQIYHLMVMKKTMKTLIINGHHQVLDLIHLIRLSLLHHLEKRKQKKQKSIQQIHHYHHQYHKLYLLIEIYQDKLENGLEVVVGHRNAEK